MLQEASDLTLVTCNNHLDLAASDQVLRCVLEELGLSVRVVSWRDRQFNWSSTRMAVLRSAWDSHLRPFEFREWLIKVSALTSLCNPTSIVDWNFDKHYLLDLQSAGVPIIPSIYVAPRSDVEFGPTAIPWDITVVKPAIGASSHGVRRFDVASQLGALNDHVKTFRDIGVLLQRFEPTVETLSERSLVFVDGQFTHAVRRLPFNVGNTPDSAEFDHKPSGDEMAFSRDVLEAAKALELPFARVDLLPSGNQILLMELELIDPSLFMTRNATAAHRLGACLINRLNILREDELNGTRHEADRV